MTEEIQKRIDDIIQKRKERMCRLMETIKECSTNFDKYIVEKENLKNKEKRKLKRILSLIRMGENCLYFRTKLIDYYKYDKDNWDLLMKVTELYAKHQKEYTMEKDKKELYKLTNCLRTLEGNPCEITCEVCGYENQIGAKYCSHCGKSFHKKSDSITCEKCGYVNTNNKYNCLMCGGVL